MRTMRPSTSARDAVSDLSTPETDSFKLHQPRVPRFAPCAAADDLAEQARARTMCVTPPTPGQWSSGAERQRGARRSSR